VALETFGDVVHHRDSGSLDLIPIAKVSLGRHADAEVTIKAHGLDPGILPNPQILELFGKVIHRRMLLFTFYLPTFYGLLLKSLPRF
jgi:hypothetical protein